MIFFSELICKSGTSVMLKEEYADGIIYGRIYSARDLCLGAGVGGDFGTVGTCSPEAKTEASSALLASCALWRIKF